MTFNHQSFDDITYFNEFDGVWASASLLHVAQNKLQLTFQNLINSLKPGGILFASFKSGGNEQKEVLLRKRKFNLQTEDSLKSLLMNISHCKLEWIQTIEDIRKVKRENFIILLIQKI